jgi:hypothetical protein
VIKNEGIDFLAVFLCIASAIIYYWKNDRDKKLLIAAQDKLTNANKIEIIFNWIRIVIFSAAAIYFILR